MSGSFGRLLAVWERMRSALTRASSGCRRRAVLSARPLPARPQADKTNNLLKNAPHTMEEVSAATWSHPYTPDQAVYPVAG